MGLAVSSVFNSVKEYKSNNQALSLERKKKGNHGEEEELQ
jgi:hypothetical protein